MEITEKLNELILYFPDKELTEHELMEHEFITTQYRHKLSSMSVQEMKDFFRQEQLPVTFQFSCEDCDALFDILTNYAHYTMYQALTIIHWLELHRKNLHEDEYYTDIDWPSMYESILMGAN